MLRPYERQFGSILESHLLVPRMPVSLARWYENFEFLSLFTPISSLNIHFASKKPVCYTSLFFILGNLLIICVCCLKMIEGKSSSWYVFIEILYRWKIRPVQCLISFRDCITVRSRTENRYSKNFLQCWLSIWKRNESQCHTEK